MSKINKLTINGTTYELEDPTATKTLFVTYSPGDDYASHTSVDIQNHVSKGGQVIFVYEDVKIPLTYLVEDDSAYFETYDPSERIKFSYRVWDDGAVDQSIEYLATTDRVTDQINDALGDIETALDGILAIQNQLIGGDA